MARMGEVTIRERFAHQLDNLREDVLRMGNLVSYALNTALKSMETWDVAMAQHVIDDDANVDTAQHELQERAITLIATQQPVASDLRLIGSVFAIATELERIGDYAVHVARPVVRLSGRRDEISLIIPDGFQEMADLAHKMLTMSLDAFLQQSSELAREVGTYDERVDELEDQVRAQLIEQTRNAPDQMEAYLEVLDVVHTLERVADRTTNIAERVIYLEKSTIEELN